MLLAEAPPEPSELRPAAGGRGRSQQRGGAASPYSSASSRSDEEEEEGAGGAGGRRGKPLASRMLRPARPGVAQGHGAVRRRVGLPGLPALAAMERKGERRAALAAPRSGGPALSSRSFCLFQYWRCRPGRSGPKPRRIRPRESECGPAPPPHLAGKGCSGRWAAPRGAEAWRGAGNGAALCR